MPTVKQSQEDILASSIENLDVTEEVEDMEESWNKDQIQDLITLSGVFCFMLLFCLFACLFVFICFYVYSIIFEYSFTFKKQTWSLWHHRLFVLFFLSKSVSLCILLFACLSVCLKMFVCLCVCLFHNVDVSLTVCLKIWRNPGTNIKLKIWSLCHFFLFFVCLFLLIFVCLSLYFLFIFVCLFVFCVSLFACLIDWLFVLFLKLSNFINFFYSLGLPPARWQNLYNLEVIKARNKPKEVVNKPKNAPFFLPTITGPDGQTR